MPHFDCRSTFSNFGADMLVTWYTVSEVIPMDQLHIQRLVTGPLETNCYILSNQETKEAVVIDPGAAEPGLLEAVASYHVTDILLTHAHFDHIGGVSELKERTGARLWIQEKEKEWLSDGTKNGSSLWLEEPITAPPADRLLQGGEWLTVAGRRARVLFTPGHSPGHVSYLVDDGVLLGGDALFAGSIGRTDLYGGDYETLIESIRTQLLTLPDETVILPGHGPASTIEDERKMNPFLQGI